MSGDEARAAAARLLLALEMADTGIEMMRATLRRRHPAADDATISRLLGDWLRERPGAEDGDANGRRVQWPR
jgi:hypothetical protein